MLLGAVMVVRSKIIGGKRVRLGVGVGKVILGVVG